MIFSITIPAYKKAFLKDAIESCLAQTFDDFELIIVNDCSPEDLDAVVSLFNDPRIRYYKNEKNFGAKDVVGNWNRCLDYATGDFVICMGDDDMLFPNCLEEYQKAILENPDVDAFHARVLQIDERGKTVKLLPDRADHESLYSFIIHRLEGRNQYIGDFCFRREKLMTVGKYFYLPYAWGSDDITSYLCAAPNGVVNINKPEFKYRVSNATISRSGYTAEKLQSLLDVDKWLKNFAANQQPKTLVEIEELKQVEDLIPKVLAHTQFYTILPELQWKRYRIIHWFLKRKKYQISFKTLIKLFLKSLGA